MTRFGSRFTSFVALFALGALGILVLIVDGLSNPGQYEELAAEAGLDPETIVVLASVQSSVLLAIAVAVGMYAGPRLGFTSRVYERANDSSGLLSASREDIRPGLAGGVAVGGMLLLAEVVSQRFLDLGGPEMTVERLVQSIPFRLLYGGITEEVLLRWGVMSLIAFVLWRLTGSSRRGPSPGIAWTAIIVSAVAFGVAHLPAAAGIYGALTAEVVAFIVVANSLGGGVFGWLYWKHSLETAMIAHATAHAAAVSVWLVVLAV